MEVTGVNKDRHRVKRLHGLFSVHLGDLLCVENSVPAGSRELKTIKHNNN